MNRLLMSPNEQIVNDRIDIPFTLISSRGDAPMTVRAMKEGAVEFLVKPLRQDLPFAARHCRQG